ncbi:MAG: hypothetical protein KC646_03720 [Candidatus Cloacimonetes bacterium]|nr:hypothetical protein [Candidatus Cloacimonadota bacterium]
MSNDEALNRLNDIVDAYGLVIIYGPSGCGKTYQIKKWKEFSRYLYKSLDSQSVAFDGEDLIIDQVDKSWLKNNLDGLLSYKSKVVLLSNENLLSILSTKVRFKVLHLFELQSAHEIYEFSRMEGFVDNIGYDLCHSLLVKFNGSQKRVVQFFEYVESFNLSYDRKSIKLFADYLGLENRSPQVKVEDQNFIRSIAMLYPFTSVHRFNNYYGRLNDLLDEGLLYIHNNCVRLKFELPSLETNTELEFNRFLQDFSAFLCGSNEHYLTDFLNLYSLCLENNDFTLLYSTWEKFYHSIILDKGSLLTFYRPFKRQGNQLKLLPIQDLELYLILAFHCESDELINYTHSNQSNELLNVLERLDSKNILNLIEQIQRSGFPENIETYLYFELLDLLIEEGSIQKAKDLVSLISIQSCFLFDYIKNRLLFFRAKLNRIEGSVTSAKKQLIDIYEKFEESNYPHEAYLALVQIAYCNLYLLDFVQLNNTIETLQRDYQNLRLKQDYFEYRLLAYKKAFEFDYVSAHALISEAYFEHGSHIKIQQETLYFCELLLFELMAGNLEKIEAYLFRISLDESKKITHIGLFLKGLYQYSTSSYSSALKLLEKCKFSEVNVGIYHTKLFVDYFISLCREKLKIKSDFEDTKREIFKNISFEAQLFYLKSLECFEVGLSPEPLQYYFEGGAKGSVLTNSKKIELNLSTFDLLINTCQQVYTFDNQELEFSNSQKVLKLLIVFVLNQDKRLDSTDIVRLWYKQTVCNDSDLNNFRVSLSRLRVHLNDQDKSIITSTKKGRVNYYQLSQNINTLLICDQDVLDYFE